MPGEAFGAPGYARLSFALGDDDLGEGVERIAKLLSDDAAAPRSLVRRSRRWCSSPCCAQLVVPPAAPAVGEHVRAAKKGCKYLQALRRSSASRARTSRRAKAPTAPGPVAVCGYEATRRGRHRRSTSGSTRHDIAERSFEERRRQPSTRTVSAVDGFGKNALYVGGGLNTLYVLRGDTLVYVQYVDVRRRTERSRQRCRTRSSSSRKIVLRRHLTGTLDRMPCTRPGHRAARRQRPRSAPRRAGSKSTCGSGSRRTSCSSAVPGAAALVIRSATQVTAEVLEAGVGPRRRRPGRHRARQRRRRRRDAPGVMVVNAPQSNVLSAAEHTIALLLAQARNIPQADADLKAGQWNRVALGGRRAARQDARHRRPRPGRRARRAARDAFGMQLVAYDPYVSADRARQLGVELVRDLEELCARPTSSRSTCRRPPRRWGSSTPSCSRTPSRALRLVNTARGGIVDEAALADAVARGRIAGAALDVFATEPTTESPLFGLDSRRGHAPPRRVDGRGAGQGGADDRRAGRARAARRVRAVRREPRCHGGERDGAAVPAAGRAAGLASSRRSRAAESTRSRSPTRARSPTTTAGCSRSGC